VPATLFHPFVPASLALHKLNNDGVDHFNDNNRQQQTIHGFCIIGAMDDFDI
jgi:hypothetical protein